MNAPQMSTCVALKAFARTLQEASPVNASGVSLLTKLVQAVKVGETFSWWALAEVDCAAVHFGLLCELSKFSIAATLVIRWQICCLVCMGPIP